MKNRHKKSTTAAGRQTNAIETSLGGGLVRKSLARQVYESLERNIVEGRIPPGTRLGEEAVAAAFAVSRGPARESIMELESKGFAERLSNRDRRVTVPSEAFIRETFDVWTLIESQRVYEASLVASKSLLLQLDALLKEIEQLARNPGTEDQVEATKAFHTTLHQGCTNRQLHRVANEFLTYIEWLRSLYLDYRSDTSELTIEDHRLIVHCFKERDRAGLLEAMQGHIIHNRDRIISAWQQSNALEMIESQETTEFKPGSILAGMS